LYGLSAFEDNEAGTFNRIQAILNLARQVAIEKTTLHSRYYHFLKYYSSGNYIESQKGFMNKFNKYLIFRTYITYL